MAGIKQIQRKNWIDHLRLFSNGNNGRLVSISLVDSKGAGERIIDELPLMAVDYDPIHKGDNIVISLGLETLAFSHTVEVPVEMWETHNDEGVVTSMKIIDQSNSECSIAFNQ